jgi:hypothetical protein
MTQCYVHSQQTNTNTCAINSAWNEALSTKVALIHLHLGEHVLGHLFFFSSQPLFTMLLNMNCFKIWAAIIKRLYYLVCYQTMTILCLGQSETQHMASSKAKILLQQKITHFKAIRYSYPQKFYTKILFLSINELIWKWLNTNVKECKPGCTYKVSLFQNSINSQQDSFLIILISSLRSVLNAIYFMTLCTLWKFNLV